MSKADDISQDAWDAALKQADAAQMKAFAARSAGRNVTDREVIARAIMKAQQDERDTIEAVLHREKYTADQGMDQEMQCYNDGIDFAVGIIRSRNP